MLDIQDISSESNLSPLYYVELYAGLVTRISTTSAVDERLPFADDRSKSELITDQRTI